MASSDNQSGVVMNYTTISIPTHSLRSILSRKIARAATYVLAIAAIFTLLSTSFTPSAIAAPVLPPQPDYPYPVAKYRPVVRTGQVTWRVGEPTSFHNCKYNTLPALIHLTINYYNEPVLESYCRHDKWAKQ